MLTWSRVLVSMFIWYEFSSVRKSHCPGKEHVCQRLHHDDHDDSVPSCLKQFSGIWWQLRRSGVIHLTIDTLFSKWLSKFPTEVLRQFGTLSWRRRWHTRSSLDNGFNMRMKIHTERILIPGLDFTWALCMRSERGFGGCNCQSRKAM